MRPLVRITAAVVPAAMLAALLGQPSAAAPTFAAAVVVNDPANAGEPAINSDSDGNLFIDFPTAIPSFSMLYKSTDGGVTWAELNTLPLVGGGDSHTVFGEATGTNPDPIYFTDLWLGSASVQKSTNGGLSFIAGANMVTTTPVSDRQWLAASGTSDVYLAYAEIGTGIWVSKSIDAGLTWVPVLAAPMPTARTGCSCPPGMITAWGQNVVVIYYTSLNDIAVARSTNGGLTYTQTTIVDGDGAADRTFAFPMLTRAPDTGRLVAAWAEKIGSAYRISTSTSSDSGVNWSAPAVAVSGATSLYPWIDAGTGGKVALAYYQSDGWTGDPDRASAGTNWFIKYAESTNGGTSWGPGVLVDGTRVKTGKICTDGLNCGGDRQLLEFPSVTVTPSNVSHVVWTRVKSGNDTVILTARQTA